MNGCTNTFVPVFAWWSCDLRILPLDGQLLPLGEIQTGGLANSSPRPRAEKQVSIPEGKHQRISQKLEILNKLGLFGFEIGLNWVCFGLNWLCFFMINLCLFSSYSFVYIEFTSFHSPENWVCFAYLCPI
ncbi:MAG: hypothetical protein RQ760_08730 [Sedimentisphaerales bacterium]|nr:hypothetical protein [Sedimentisphaerales bacterium]